MQLLVKFKQILHMGFRATSNFRTVSSSDRSPQTKKGHKHQMTMGSLQLGSRDDNFPKNLLYFGL